MSNPTTAPAPATATRSADGRLRTAGRLVLGTFLAFAGIGHMTFQREEFQAQVPNWFPLDADLVVLGSGVVEISLGVALLGWRSRGAQVGWVTAAFFVVVFPGNIAQYVEGTTAFGLDTDAKRLGRLFFQPVLAAWALWSTGAWQAWRASRTSGADPRAAVTTGR